MRFFEFSLQLPDGRIVGADAVAESWQWSAAFAEACANTEARYGLGPWAGIICVEYRSSPATTVSLLSEADTTAGVPTAA